ncbi:TPA: GTP cyclohydrolase I FolE, partial [Vibrio cholerae O1]
MSTLSKEAILVRSALEARGLETPRIETSLTNAEKKARIEAHMRG